MNTIQSGVCNGKIWVIPNNEETNVNSRFVIADKQKKISNINLNWYDDKVAYAEELLALLAECNLLPNPCFEFQTETDCKYWTVNKSGPGKGSFGIDFRPEWTLEDGHTAYLHVSNASNISISTIIPIVDASLPFRFSGFFGTHRTQGIVRLTPINESNQKSQSLSYIVPQSNIFRGGTQLNDYAYHQWSFDLPHDTIKIELTISLGEYHGHDVSVNSSFLFFTNLYFGVLGDSFSAYIPYSPNAFKLSTYLSRTSDNTTVGIAPLPRGVSQYPEITLAIENSEAEGIALKSQENITGKLTVKEEAIDRILALDIYRAVAIVRWPQSGRVKIIDQNNQTITGRFGRISNLKSLQDKLLKGENLLLNSDFANGYQGWHKINEARLNFSDSTRLKNGNCAYLYSIATREKKTDRFRIYTNKDAVTPFPLLPNHPYVLSGYFGYHRCLGCIGLEWLDENNRTISSHTLNPERPESRGGEHLQGYDLQKTTLVCPPGAKQVRIFIEKSCTIFGAKDSFLFFTRLFFGLESTEGETFWRPAKNYLNNSEIQKSLFQEGFWAQAIEITTPDIRLNPNSRLLTEDHHQQVWQIHDCYLDDSQLQINNFLLLEGAIAASAGEETLALYHQLRSQINYQDFSLNQDQVAYKQPRNQSHDLALQRQIHKIQNSQLWLKDWYVNQYPEANSFNEPLEHFLTQGWKKNCQPNPYFDIEFYQQNNHNETKSNPLLHYVDSGWRNSKDPSPKFSVDAYLAENPHLFHKGQEPLGHLLANGVRGIGNAPAYDLENPHYYVIPHQTKGSEVVKDSALRGMIDFEKVPLAPKNKHFKAIGLNLHWIIPDFAPGAGGHMTIFRIIRFLELFGHQQTIWIHNPHPFRTSEEAFTLILKHFLPLRAKVKYIDMDRTQVESEFEQAEGDIAIATDWGSVYPVLSMSKFKTRFYFVQDYEPMFYPMGSHYLAAEATYKEDLNCICASQWLKSLMADRYQRWARNFWLAPDRTYYYPRQDQKPFNKQRLRIALYARTFTSRRAVELAILALEVLARRHIDIHVDFFGEPLNLTEAPFTCSFHGILPMKKLGELYRECDLGLVFSSTNYSLVPQEMMACGLPVIDLDVESTQLTYEKGVVTLAKPLPHSIADAVISLMENDEIRKKQINKALDWVSKFTWQESAKLVEKAFLDRLQELSYQPLIPTTKSTAQIKVSVVIPTYNGGSLFKKVLQRLSTQCLPWEYEVIVIDSGSNDDTIEIVKKFSKFRLHQIDKKDFGHGKTRNLGAEMAKGEYVAFLTQDALPVNDTWLYDLIVFLECYPQVAGVFGRHLAYPDASTYTKRDLHNHFAKYDNLPLVFNKQLKASNYGLDEATLKRILHFYSDNNSCFRKSVWQEFPYPDVVYGEDQLWAKHIINRGYSTAYSKNAVVYHSHDYDEREIFERSRVEAHFFNQYFGYEMVNRNALSTEFILDKLNRHDIEWGKNQGLSDEEIAKRCSLNIAGIAGYMQGKKDADSCKEICL
ncbi:glycosyltransferase [Pleurocapsa sp. PCC 7319]|uniref:rhamnosyltransferase WsaF family glycosyltransferase n=1 Tax=Pleurocapsa sp. PCC 7319 TaxID=118161 RepID=UPI00034DE5FD|nr:glycosyltransferase [Pleurocapsa sp. PCC 7319]